MISNVIQLAQEAGQTVKKGIFGPDDSAPAKVHGRKLGIFAHGEEKVSVHRDDPVFDGQFSNLCYQNAVRQAFFDFSQKAEKWTELSHEPTTRSPNSGLASSCTCPTPTRPSACSRTCSATTGNTRRCGTTSSTPSAPCPNAQKWKTRTTRRAWESEKDAYRRQISKTPQYTAFHASRIEKGNVRAVSLATNTPAPFSWR